MRHLSFTQWLVFFGAVLCFSLIPPVWAEDDMEEDSYEEETEAEELPKLKPVSPKKKSSSAVNKSKTRKYFTDDTPRSDAGIFHVGFALGGNVYIEPKLFKAGNSQGGQAGEFADDYFKDFGYQGGVYFDYDYSRTTENIPLALRGFLGYKYALNSTHIFAAEGMVRRMFNVSESTDFGLGAGVSLATWFRQTNLSTADEESEIEQTVLLPTFIVEAGFDFNPFMVDLKWMIHRFGTGETLMGAEFYFGVRL